MNHAYNPIPPRRRYCTECGVPVETRRAEAGYCTCFTCASADEGKIYGVQEQDSDGNFHLRMSDRYPTRDRQPRKTFPHQR